MIFRKELRSFRLDSFLCARIHLVKNTCKRFRDIPFRSQFRISAVHTDPFFRIHGEILPEYGSDIVRFLS